MKTSYDVVVVGGGIIGCSTAAELAGLGADVLLLERHEIAHGASGRNHGLLYYPQNPVTEALFRRSHAIYRERAADSDLDLALDPEPCGFVILVASEAEWDAADREAEACRAGGVPVEQLDRDELRALEPKVSPDYIGGYRIEDGYRLDPQALTLAQALEARRRGAEVRTHTDVKQILVRRGRVRGVVGDEGRVGAGSVVLAGGPWSSRLGRTAGLELEVSGARGWLLLVRPEEPVTGRLLESSGWHVQAGDPGPEPVTVDAMAREELPVSKIGLLIQPTGGGNVLLGGSRLPSLRIDPEGTEVPNEIARRAVAALPALSRARVLQVWSGVRPMSPDGLPILGWAPGVGGLFVATGHGAQGVMQGGGSGRLAAELVTGSEPFTDPAPFACDRPALASS